MCALTLIALLGALVRGEAGVPEASSESEKTPPASPPHIRNLHTTAPSPPVGQVSPAQTQHALRQALQTALQARPDDDVQAAAEKTQVIAAIAKEVACNFCALLVEDMWSVTVQKLVAQPKALFSWEGAVEKESRVWLEGLCRNADAAATLQLHSSMLQRFVGLYDIAASPPGGSTRAAVLSSQGC
jgi:hypothetical protein